MHQSSPADRRFLGLAYGALPPIVLFLAAWWSAIPLLPETQVPFAASAGPAIGLLLDIALLRRALAADWVRSTPALVSLYGVYSVLLFGFFMGVPVPNVGLGVVAGVVAIRTGHSARATGLMTCTWLLGLCVASAILALRNPWTPSDIEGMFGLPFTVTWSMVVWVIAIGGVLLLTVQYLVTEAAATLARRHEVAHRIALG
jgi:hypothetical protein